MILQNPTPADVKFYVTAAINTGEKMNFESAISLAAIVFNMDSLTIRSIMFGGPLNNPMTKGKIQEIH